MGIISKPGKPPQKKGKTDHWWWVIPRSWSALSRCFVSFFGLVGGLNLFLVQLNGWTSKTCKYFSISFGMFMVLGRSWVYPSTSSDIPIVAEQRPPNPKLHIRHYTTGIVGRWYNRSRELYFQPSSKQNPYDTWLSFDTEWFMTGWL